MDRNKNVMVNIAPDGLETAIIKDTSDALEIYEENAKEYISRYLKNTQVGKMLFNVNYKRSIVDSNVADSILYNIERNSDGTVKKDEHGNAMKTIVPVCESTTMLSKYRAMIERKIDVIDMVIGMTHDYEAEAWLSVRMNDHHFFDDPGFNSLFSYKYAEQVGVNHSRTYLDFSKTAVQNYYKAYITELCEKYDIDGIELDFLRSCPIMTNVNEENRQTLNRFVQEIRNIIDQFSEKRGKEIRLSARVYPEEQMNLDYGVDAAQWIADGSISTLVVEGWYIPTYYHIPVHNWRESIDARNTQNYPYSLLCGADWAVRCDSRAKEGYIMWLTLEQLKGFASSAYESGADGIYFFNHFNPNSDAGAITYYIDEDGVKTRKNILTEKFTAALSQEASEIGLRTYVRTCRDYSNTLYPIVLSDTFHFIINTGSKPEAGYYSVVIGLDDCDGYDENLLSVTVNGSPATQIGDVPHVQGYHWNASSVSEPVASHVSETAPRVMQFVADDLSAIKDGENQITITNPSGKPQNIKWLEVRIDSTNGAYPTEMGK